MMQTKIERKPSLISEQSSQRSKPKLKISTTVLTRSSTMNTVRMMATASKMGLHRSPSNFFFDTMEKIQSRTPPVKVDSKTMTYDKLKVTSSQQYFREDWGGVTAIRYLQDGERLAIGFNSGDLQICTSMMSGLRSVPCDTILKGWEGNDSISCIQFHPKKPNVLYATSTAGTVMRRDLEDNTNYNDFFITEIDNEIYSMDFTNNGDLVTVGRDANIRIYDVTAEVMISKFGRRISTSTYEDSQDSSSSDFYHEKRIYCVRCHPSEPYLLVSGGWDGVKVWDSRTETAVRNIEGPFIFGDTVDICKGTILTASCEAANNLQLWDLGSGFLINSVNPPNKRLYLYGEYPYAAQFFKGDPSGDLVLYGVGGLQLISVKESSILYLFEDEKPVTAVDSTEKKLAFGGKSNCVFHGKIVLPESDAISGTLSYVSARSFSTGSNQSSMSGSKKDILEN